MIAGHPLVARTYMRERFLEDGRWHQTLVVETHLPPPARKDEDIHPAWDRLFRQLENITTHGFANCTAFEVKPKE